MPDTLTLASSDGMPSVAVPRECPDCIVIQETHFVLRTEHIEEQRYLQAWLKPLKLRSRRDWLVRGRAFFFLSEASSARFSFRPAGLRLSRSVTFTREKEGTETGALPFRSPSSRGKAPACHRKHSRARHLEHTSVRGWACPSFWNKRML